MTTTLKTADRSLTIRQHWGIHNMFYDAFSSPVRLPHRRSAPRLEVRDTLLWDDLQDLVTRFSIPSCANVDDLLVDALLLRRDVLVTADCRAHSVSELLHLPVEPPLPSPSAQSTPTRWTSGLGSATETQQPPEKRREDSATANTSCCKGNLLVGGTFCLTVRVPFSLHSPTVPPTLSRAFCAALIFFHLEPTGTWECTESTNSLFYCGPPFSQVLKCFFENKCFFFLQVFFLKVKKTFFKVFFFKQVQS